MDTTRFRGNAMLFQRVGNLNPQKQKHMIRASDETFEKDSHRNPVAPEYRGIWAFPYPYFDFFFVAYQGDNLCPKRFRTRFDQIRQAYLDGEVSSHEHGDLLDVVAKELRDWTRKSAPASTKIRKIWVEGNIYTHLSDNPNSREEWNLVSVGEFARLLQKQYARDLKHVTRWNSNWGPKPEGQHKIYHPQGWPTSIDHLEVFIPTSAKVS
jgi:hypothetical protein